MQIDYLVSQIRENRPDAAGTAAKLGSQASPYIAPLADDPNPEVRAMALLCLGVTGGSLASEKALEKLNDADEQVFSQALQVLQRHPPFGKERQLVEIFERSDRMGIRENLPLIAGRLAPHVDSKPWLNSWQKETDPQVRESLTVALSRMGNPQAREEFVKKLMSAQGPDVIRWLEHCNYMQDPWILPDVVLLLDRTEEALELNPDGKNKWPLRVCDLAVRTIIELTGARVSFPVKRPSQFTSQEIEEVRQIALRRTK